MASRIFVLACSLLHMSFCAYSVAHIRLPILWRPCSAELTCSQIPCHTLAASHASCACSLAHPSLLMLARTLCLTRTLKCMPLACARVHIFGVHARFDLLCYAHSAALQRRFAQRFYGAHAHPHVLWHAHYAGHAYCTCSLAQTLSCMLFRSRSFTHTLYCVLLARVRLHMNCCRCSHAHAVLRRI